MKGLFIRGIDAELRQSLIDCGFEPVKQDVYFNGTMVTSDGKLRHPSAPFKPWNPDGKGWPECKVFNNANDFLTTAKEMLKEEMKTLDLVLKRKWFEMIASGEKTEEYREIKPYWVSRLGGCFRWCSQTLNNYGLYQNRCNTCSNIKNLNKIASNGYDAVTFHLGYSKDRPSMTFAIKEIIIDEGKEEWGAEKDKSYFVIHLGKRL